ncbi:MAG: acyltransferase domain-containing protein, partial [Mobilitalea sp.]
MVVIMRKKRFEFEECVVYCGFDNLPEGLSQYFDLYEEKEQSYLIGKVFLQDIFDRYQIPQEKQSIMLSAIDEIEQDTVLFYFTKFLVWDMCSARNRCDIDNYTNMMPVCLKEYKEFYSLLLLFACVEPSMQLLMDRGVPLEYYQQIPYQPMEAQLRKWLDKDDISVSDFPWDMNFYTCAIFLMDRFFFIPYKFGDNLTMYRNHSTNKVIALRHADEEFRRDGQVNGINKVFDETGKFTSVWLEEADFITANPISPMGYVQKEPITIHKEDWDTALEPGDTLLALHVPSGPGYTPERLRTSMMLALEFYKKYFPELPIKGFWSESWLYDSRLSLILDNEKS